MKIKETIHEHIEVANSLIGISENIENICTAICLLSKVKKLFCR